MAAGIGGCYRRWLEDGGWRMEGRWRARDDDAGQAGIYAPSRRGGGLRWWFAVVVRGGGSRGLRNLRELAQSDGTLAPPVSRPGDV